MKWNPLKMSPLTNFWLFFAILEHTQQANLNLCSGCTLRVYFQNQMDVPCDGILTKGIEKEDLWNPTIVWDKGDPALRYLVVLVDENENGMYCFPEIPEEFIWIRLATMESTSKRLQFFGDPVIESSKQKSEHHKALHRFYLMLYNITSEPDEIVKAKVLKRIQDSAHYDFIMEALGVRNSGEYLRGFHKFRFTEDESKRPELSLQPRPKALHSMPLNARASPAIRSSALWFYGVLFAIFIV